MDAESPPGGSPASWPIGRRNLVLITTWRRPHHSSRSSRRSPQTAALQQPRSPDGKHTLPSVLGRTNETRGGISPKRKYLGRWKQGIDRPSRWYPQKLTLRFEALDQR